MGHQDLDHDLPFIFSTPRRAIPFSAQEKTIEGEDTDLGLVLAPTVLFHATARFHATTTPRPVLNMPTGLMFLYLGCRWVARARQ